jgi:FKBP-type peptidyl-prolyl cis-trans isomerase
MKEIAAESGGYNESVLGNASIYMNRSQFISLLSAALVLGGLFVTNYPQAQARNMSEDLLAQVNENAVTTPSGLKYVDQVVGQGASPRQGQTVVVHYTGWLTNGKKFDSSVDRGQPFNFVLGAGQVIKGWDEGVATMHIGGKRRLVIPAGLAYGSKDVGNGLIPPNSTLVFDVELLGVQ